MKKKGFTLIELLAVIVILAIIALIATPLVLKYIEYSKENSTKLSANAYAEEVEKQITLNELDSSATKIAPGTYSVDDLSALGVTVKGNKPTRGSVVITNKQVTEYTLVIGQYTVTFKKGVTEVSKGSAYQVYPNGTAIYYNPVIGEKCDSTKAVSTTGTKAECMKWYTFNDSKTSSTVDMILDHNTTAKVAWDSTGNGAEMKEVKTAIETDTANWKEKATARLITADEIAKIVGNKTFNGLTSTSGFYFDKGASTYAWLFDYTKGCTSYGCNREDLSNFGYWTSTLKACPSGYTCTASAWVVSRNGNLSTDAVINGNQHGVRPVITISKSIIS